MNPREAVPTVVVYNNKGQKTAVFRRMVTAEELASGLPDEGPLLPRRQLLGKAEVNFWKLVWRELLHRRSQLISGLLAITLGIGVIVGDPIRHPGVGDRRGDQARQSGGEHPRPPAGGHRG